MLTVLKFVLLLSVAVWVGGMVMFTFLVTPEIFKTLPREVAGDLVGRLFPKYWALGYAAGVISLACLLAVSYMEKAYPAVRIALLVFMTAMTFYSGMVVSPKAAALKAEIRAADGARADELRARFRGLHAQSFGLNVAVLAAGVVFIFLMAKDSRF